jgi:hypothetical protein
MCWLNSLIDNNEVSLSSNSNKIVTKLQTKQKPIRDSQPIKNQR